MTRFRIPRIFRCCSPVFNELVTDTRINLPTRASFPDDTFVILLGLSCLV